MKRARRRADKDRMKDRARRVFPDWPGAVKCADHIALCSCMGCRNERDLYGETLQEYRSDLSFELRAEELNRADDHTPRPKSSKKSKNQKIRSLGQQLDHVRRKLALYRDGKAGTFWTERVIREYEKDEHRILEKMYGLIMQAA